MKGGGEKGREERGRGGRGGGGERTAGREGDFQTNNGELDATLQ